MNRILAVVEIVWEIPLAVLSFLFYKLSRLVVQSIVRLYARQHPEQATQWRVLRAPEVLAPFNLVALMTSAPRWNTHAIIALAGPLSMKQGFRLYAPAAARSARAWTIVVHAEPGHRIVASVGSQDAAEQTTWRVVQLPPGDYRLALRYYAWIEPVELPAIEADGVEVVPALTIPADANSFYADLSKKSNLLYRCLHYYVGPLLRYQKWLPRAFVEREYLPASNPQTEFYYGFVKKGSALDIELNPQLLHTYDVYFTAYDRASFPIMWYRLQESSHITPRMPTDSTYLMRVHCKRSTAESFRREWVQIHTLRYASHESEEPTAYHARDSVQKAKL
jgi:hypothetical protein